MTKEPRVMYFDIETSPNLVFAWSLGKQYVTMDNIHKERKVTCICYKWQGDSRIHSLKMKMKLHDLSKQDDNADLDLLSEFCEIYKNADLAVGHNAIKFDIAFIRSRLVKYGLPDIAPVVLDDTYLSSKGIRFNSHKLDYLSQYLGLGKKAPHPYQLWVDVMRSSEDALDRTVEYCKHDVRLLEKVYDSLLPYINTKLNRAAHFENNRMCPSCGLQKLVVDGTIKRVTCGVRTRMRCTSCGKYCTTGTTALTDAKSYPR